MEKLKMTKSNWISVCVLALVLSCSQIDLFSDDPAHQDEGRGVKKEPSEARGPITQLLDILPEEAVLAERAVHQSASKHFIDWDAAMAC